jgi:hypothetical protein
MDEADLRGYGHAEIRVNPLHPRSVSALFSNQYSSLSIINYQLFRRRHRAGRNK